MRANPFCETSAPPWLISDQVPRTLDLLLRAAERAPQLYDALPWLRRMDVLLLCHERQAHADWPEEPPSPQEARLMAFFAAVTQPIADMIEALYVSPLWRPMTIVREILSRMAQVQGTSVLPDEVVVGVCASFLHRRAMMDQDPIRPQNTTWDLTWQQPLVRVRTALGSQAPFLVLVTDAATGRILAFRSTLMAPQALDVVGTLYDALAFPGTTRAPYVWHICPPTRLRVQTPLPEAIVQAATSWQIELEEIMPQDNPFVQRWEDELADRVLDPVQYLRILDRACERAFGHAPFLAKQQRTRQLGWAMTSHHEPSWTVPSLRTLLPAYPATVGEDGTLEWHGWHYRDRGEDVLRYWPNAEVLFRPTVSSEAAVWVYWNQALLCHATADELRHADGSYRPYWFPYPRLGE